MNTLRRICAVTILSLTVALSASAGDIHAPGLVSTGTGTTATSTTVILTIVRLTY